MTATEYDREFYDRIRLGCQQSADVISRLVVHRLGRVPGRVLDVGCGEGWWAAAFAELGSEVVGVDGGYVDPVGISRDRLVPADLAAGVPDVGSFDLAVCLEVAEHLPAEAAPELVAGLCRSAPLVLFSAAIPGQGGEGHVNEQWPAYWQHLFDCYGFSGTGALRWQIWNDERVEPWYRQNLLVFGREASLDLLGMSEQVRIPAVVHPHVYEWALQR